jgi:hypothetical protein
LFRHIPVKAWQSWKFWYFYIHAVRSVENEIVMQIYTGGPWIMTWFRGSLLHCGIYHLQLWSAQRAEWKKKTSCFILKQFIWWNEWASESCSINVNLRISCSTNCPFFTINITFFFFSQFSNNIRGLKQLMNRRVVGWSDDKLPSVVNHHHQRFRRFGFIPSSQWLRLVGMEADWTRRRF